MLKSKDTIKLMTKEDVMLFKGEMMSNFYEKDRNSGSSAGIIKGDILFLDYDFEAEGTKSERALIFLNTENALIQGHGKVEVDAHNTTVFKKDQKILFDKKFPLMPVNCEKLNL